MSILIQHKNIARKNIALALALVSVLALGACTNTVHGAGQDIENAGESIQDASD